MTPDQVCRDFLEIVDEEGVVEFGLGRMYFIPNSLIDAARTAIGDE